ncbi:hypothetical protein D3C73_517540 [compost metagenome]
MEIGGAKIVIFGANMRVMTGMSVITMMTGMAMAAMMSMVAAVMMIVVIAQQPGAEQVYGQADDGHEDRLIEIDRHRICQAHEAFPGDEQHHQRQHHSTGETGEITQLAGPKGVTRVLRIAPCIHIGQRRDQHGSGMGGHVPAIGRQRHRPEDRAGDDFRHHHRGGQRNDQPDLTLVALMIRAEKHVLMLQTIDTACHDRLHFQTSTAEAASKL